MPSFDIAIKVDPQEIDNAVNNATKELSQRYDFKGSKSKIDWDKKTEITLIADDEYKLTALLDILQSKMMKRGISIKNIVLGKIEPAFEGTVKQKLTIQSGIPSEKAKEIIKLFKDTKMKVQSQIQDEQVRVTGKKRDDLQDCIALVRKTDLGLDLQFINFRD